MDIKEYYEKIQKKVGLPTFESINSEFELELIKEGYPARKIAESVIDRTEKYREIIEKMLQPDAASLSSLIEVKAIDDPMTEKLSLIYKELMILNRGFLITELENREDAWLSFTKQSLEKWNELKPIIKEIMRLAKDSWKLDFKLKEELGYLG